jgi:nucleoid DNA-binding protein
VVDAVALKTERAKSEVEMVLDSMLEVIVGALHANERVDLRGFGSFIAAKRDASFKASKELSQSLTDQRAPTDAGSAH